MSHPMWYTTSMKRSDWLNILRIRDKMKDKKTTKSNINYDKLTPYEKKRLEGKGCPPSP